MIWASDHPLGPEVTHAVSFEGGSQVEDKVLQDLLVKGSKFPEADCPSMAQNCVIQAANTESSATNASAAAADAQHYARLSLESVGRMNDAKVHMLEGKVEECQMPPSFYGGLAGNYASAEMMPSATQVPGDTHPSSASVVGSAPALGAFAAATASKEEGRSPRRSVDPATGIGGWCDTVLSVLQSWIVCDPRRC